MPVRLCWFIGAITVGSYQRLSHLAALQSWLSRSGCPSHLPSCRSLLHGGSSSFRLISTVEEYRQVHL